MQNLRFTSSQLIKTNSLAYKEYYRVGAVVDASFGAYTAVTNDGPLLYFVTKAETCHNIILRGVNVRNYNIRLVAHTVKNIVDIYTISNADLTTLALSSHDMPINIMAYHYPVLNVTT